MPENPKPFSFRLPKAETVEAYVVELPGGRRVVRGADQVTPAPGKPIPPPPTPERQP